MTTIITLTYNSDFWIVAHKRGLTIKLGFFYSDQGNENMVAELAAEAIAFSQCKPARASIDLSEQFKMHELKKGVRFSIKSPATGKSYRGESEGDALQALFTAEPDAILAWPKILTEPLEGEISAIAGNVQVHLSYIGEGEQWDYDPTNLEDYPRLRMDIMRKGRYGGEDVENSFCTQIDARTDQQTLKEIAGETARILNRIPPKNPIHQPEILIKIKGNTIYLNPPKP